MELIFLGKDLQKEHKQRLIHSDCLQKSKGVLGSAFSHYFIGWKMFSFHNKQNEKIKSKTNNTNKNTCDYSSRQVYDLSKTNKKPSLVNQPPIRDFRQKFVPSPKREEDSRGLKNQSPTSGFFDSGLRAWRARLQETHKSHWTSIIGESLRLGIKHPKSIIEKIQSH